MVNPVNPILSRMGEAQLVPGAGTLAGNKILADLYDPDHNQKVRMDSCFSYLSDTTLPVILGLRQFCK